MAVLADLLADAGGARAPRERHAQLRRALAAAVRHGHDELGRRYFPGVEPARLTDDQRDLLLDDIDADLAAAARVVPHLPGSSRVAVCAAHDLFAELSARLRRTPAEVLRARRVRVPQPVKARVVAAAVLRGGMPR